MVSFQRGIINLHYGLYSNVQPQTVIPSLWPINAKWLQYIHWMINFYAINIRTAIHSNDMKASMDTKYERRKFKNI